MVRLSRYFGFLLAFITVTMACAAPAAVPTAASPTATVAPVAALPTATVASAPAAPGTLNVFAAASLTLAFGDIGKGFEAANPGIKVTFNFAGSNDLAAQIGKGAPADV